jgi:hypothetical protein
LQQSTILAPAHFAGDDEPGGVGPELQFAITPVDELEENAFFARHRWEPVDVKEVRARGIAGDCPGLWKASKTVFDKQELSADYYCFSGARANGPFAHFELGKLRAKGVFENGVNVSEERFTGLLGEAKPALTAALVGKQNGYALYSLDLVKCQSARAAAITFSSPKGAAQSPSARLSYSNSNKVLDQAVDKIFKYWFGEQKKDLLDGNFATAFRLFDQAIKNKSELLRRSKAIIAENKWKLALEGNAECAAAGGQWKTAEATKQNAIAVRYYTCQKGDLLVGPFETRVTDREGRPLLNTTGHYKQGIIEDYAKTVPGGDRPVQTLARFGQDYGDYALFNTVENECAMSHRTKISYRKEADGTFTMLRESQDGSGAVVKEPDVAVATLIEQLKQGQGEGKAGKPTGTSL